MRRLKAFETQFTFIIKISLFSFFKIGTIKHTCRREKHRCQHCLCASVSVSDFHIVIHSCVLLLIMYYRHLKNKKKPWILSCCCCYCGSAVITSYGLLILLFPPPAQFSFQYVVLSKQCRHKVLQGQNRSTRRLHRQYIFCPR